MDNFFELLLPLLFVGIYFLTNLLGRKKGGGESEERGAEQSAPGENADELRRIREELKRKMRERGGSPAGGPSGPDGEATTAGPTGQEDREGGAVLRESHPKRSRGMRESRQRKMGGEGGEDTRTSTAPSPAPTPSSPSPVPSPVDRQWNERMAEIRRTQEEAERIRRETGSTGLPPYREGAGRARSRAAGALPAASSYRQFLRASLAEPYNLRRSFLLSEVFGTPLGLRENNRSRPSWEL